MPELTVNTVKKVKDLDLIFGVLGADVDLRTFVAQMITTLELFALEIRNRLKELEKATDVVGIMFIAEVDSDADTGGGYYKCHLQTLDATDWDTTTADQVDDKGDEVIVLNLAEMGGSTWSLSAGDLIQCFKFRDDEKNVRYVGVEVFGRHTSSIVGTMYIAEVDSDVTGKGGYYNCHLQDLDATDWESDTADQVDDKGNSVVVLNLAEIGTAIHNLDAGDHIQCFKFKDDEENIRYVGSEVFGRHTFGEW